MSGSSPRRWFRSSSLRLRLLAGVLIPGLAVIVAASAVGYQQVSEAQDRLSRADRLQRSIASNGEYFPLVLAERAASVAFLADPGPRTRGELDSARAAVDQLNRANEQRGDEFSIGSLVEQLPPQAQQTFIAYAASLQELPSTRARVDALAFPARDAVRAYAPLTDVLQRGNDALSPVVGSTEIGARVVRSGHVQRIADLVDRARVLTSAELRAAEPDAVSRAEIVQLRGAYTDWLDQATPLLEPGDQEIVTAMRAGPDWQVFDAGVAAMSDGGGPGTNPPDPAAFDRASGELAGTLLTTGLEANRTSWVAEADAARASLTASIRNAVLLLLGLLLATTITAVVASRVVRRLGRLRTEALELADGRLPAIVDRLRRGERIDLDSEVPALDHGSDEIGQVASAFNHAQRTAVRAAADEATTRAGFNSAFLNIARRSQGILQQQIEVLDQVERAESDPDQLRLLFRLDHLATRERRNAENLIILGGEQPRRRWRKPVPLRELVRGAVGESEYYQRVTVGWLPDVRVVGPAVGDLVHLLAELIDNATAFSPPGAPIEVRGTVVGRGIAIEVEDQGLGMEDARFDEVNETLRNPADFGLLALSGDSRIGLFVVAWLARKHDMLVALRRSTYGGVLAGVLIPTQVVANPGDDPGPEQTGDRAHAPDPGPGREDRVHDQSGEPARGHHGEAPHRRGPVPEQLDPLPAQRLAERVPARAAPVLAAAGPGGLPELPRRRRQERLSPQLRGGAGAGDEPDELRAPPPDIARSRMAALQQGSKAARRSREPEPTRAEEQP